MIMKEVPKTKIKLTDVPDLFDKGYNFLMELREELDTPVVKVKFLTEEIIAVYGEEAARKFYDPIKFKREGAMPRPLLKPLFGEDAVQTLDGKEYNHRKKYFMDLMTPERMEDYRKIVDQNLSEELAKKHGEFNLFDLANSVLFDSIAEWSGIKLEDYDSEEVETLVKNQISMISNEISSPTNPVKGITDVNELEEWGMKLIKEARENPDPEKEDRALYVFANATDFEEELLPIQLAAIELLNIIRPTVRLSVWMTLMGHALFAKEDIYEELKADFDHLQDPFIQEMRRYYPYLPALPAISIDNVEINGYHIPKDSWVILDLYGTNHDSRTIDHPEDFDIKRYIDQSKDLFYEEEYEMIAQTGGKQSEMYHRANESITFQSMRVFSDYLVNKHQFSVPEQDWTIPMNQFPTYPNSKALLVKDK